MTTGCKITAFIVRLILAMVCFVVMSISCDRRTNPDPGTDPDPDPDPVMVDAFELVGKKFNFLDYEIISPAEAGLVGVWQFYGDAYYQTQRGWRFEFSDRGLLVQWLRNLNNPEIFDRGAETTFLCTVVGMSNSHYGTCIYKVVENRLHIFWLNNGETIPDTDYWEVYNAVE